MSSLTYAIAFVLSVNSPSQEKNADLLIESIRTYGGKYANAPIYLVVKDSLETPCINIKSRGNVFLRNHKLRKNIDYYFADKVYACAQIEDEAQNQVDNLVWLDNVALMFKEPKKLVLNGSYKIGIRPVFLHNGIALDFGTKPNAYWNGIYSHIGLKPEYIPIVETSVDEKKVYAYYNCQVVTVDPQIGIFRSWAKMFDEILADTDFVKNALPSFWHQYFLHQAILSAIITSKIKPKEILTFPLSYNYSLNYHNKFSKSKKVKRINDVVIAIYELLQNNPNWVQEYKVENPLKEWINQRIPNPYRVNNKIYREEGSCNSYIIETSDGFVLVDPGGASDSTSWLAYNYMNKRIKAIILTHSHSDHLLGISKWHRNYEVPIYISKYAKEFVKDEEILEEFYKKRSSVQGNVLPRPKINWTRINYFDDMDTLQVDNLQFIIYSCPSETPDASIIVIPEMRVSFCGDSYYTSFPNIGLLRGSVPRKIKGYIDAMNIVINNKSEFLLPGHGDPIVGESNVIKKVKNYRDGIQFIFDKTIDGMNAGKNPVALMNEVLLPDTYGINEFYGRSSWTVRGIYDYYNGWFNGNIEDLYPTLPFEIHPLLLKIIGSTKVILDEISCQFKLGNHNIVLYLTQIVLTNEPKNRKALQLRLDSINELRIRCNNFIERKWLDNEKKKIIDGLNS